MKHPIEAEELMAYLDGELLIDRASAAATHLERCRDCQGLAADLQGVSQRLRAWQVEPTGSGLTPAVAAALAERARKPVVRKRWRLSPWVWGLASACVIVLAALPMFRLHQNMAPLPRLKLASALQAPEGVGTTLPTPMIARTSQLTLTTKEFDRARLGLEGILKRHAGYLGELNASAPLGAGRVLDATLRVPADKLDTVMADLKKLGRVESESQRGEEVSKQYTDLEARLTNARNAEHRLTDLLRQRTGKLADVLAVELEIDRVRGEIERMDAEKKALLNRVNFATLHVKLAEDYQAQLNMAPDSKRSQFRNAAVEGFRNMVEGLFSVALSLASYGPSLLIWAGLLFFPVRFAWRRWRAR